MNFLKKSKKNIIAALFATAMLLSVISSTGCRKPMEYSTIEDRFIELVEASEEVNRILFGEGLATYERVTDPKSTVETITVDDVRYYYYNVPDKDLERVVAYRSSYLEPYKYMEVVKVEKEGKKYDYKDKEAGIFGYLLEEYDEPQYDFYYSSTDPSDYDYVRIDSGYTSIDNIKAYAQTVYSKNYLEKTVYETLFDGVASLNEEYLTGRTARYFEYTDSDGEVWLMKSNTYKSVMREAKLIYDFSTAKVVKPYKDNFVNISINCYYEDEPSKVFTRTISMVYENGSWLLDNQTI